MPRLTKAEWQLVADAVHDKLLGADDNVALAEQNDSPYLATMKARAEALAKLLRKLEGHGA
jgi:hypothetical protein